MKQLTLSAILIALAAVTVATLAFAEDSPATKRLKECNKQFAKDIVEVTGNVYTAIGYTAPANSMIIGDDGIIIVDQGPTQRAGLGREYRQDDPGEAGSPGGRPHPADAQHRSRGADQLSRRH